MTIRRSFSALAILMVVATMAFSQTVPAEPKVQWFHMSNHPFAGSDPLSLAMSSAWTPSVMVLMESKDPSVTSFVIILNYVDQSGQVITMVDSKPRGAQGNAMCAFLVPKGVRVKSVKVDPQTWQGKSYVWDGDLPNGGMASSSSQ